MRRDNPMLEIVMLSWIALAVLLAYGFHLVRRHYMRIGEAQRRHPMWGNTATNYDWDKEED